MSCPFRHQNNIMSIYIYIRRRETHAEAARGRDSKERLPICRTTGLVVRGSRRNVRSSPQTETNYVYPHACVRNLGQWLVKGTHPRNINDF